MRTYRAPGHLPVLHYLIRDLIMFRRQGLSWGSALASAIDYWRFDRAI